MVAPELQAVLSHAYRVDYAGIQHGRQMAVASTLFPLEMAGRGLPFPSHAAYDHRGHQPPSGSGFDERGRHVLQRNIVSPSDARFHLEQKRVQEQRNGRVGGQHQNALNGKTREARNHEPGVDQGAYEIGQSTPGESGQVAHHNRRGRCRGNPNRPSRVRARQRYEEKLQRHQQRNGNAAEEHGRGQPKELARPLPTAQPVPATPANSSESPSADEAPELSGSADESSGREAGQGGAERAGEKADSADSGQSEGLEATEGTDDQKSVSVRHSSGQERQDCDSTTIFRGDDGEVQEIEKLLEADFTLRAYECHDSDSGSSLLYDPNVEFC